MSYIVILMSFPTIYSMNYGRRQRKQLEVIDLYYTGSRIHN